MNTLHVCHIVEAFGGGTLTAVAAICNGLTDGFHHTVIHSIRPETPNNFAARFPENTRFIQLDMGREVRIRQDYAAYRAVCQALSAVKPDIVHCHSSKAGVLGRIAAWNLGLPSVYTPHGYSFLRLDISKTKRHFYRVCERACTYLGQGTIACGHEEFELAQTLSGRNKRNVEVPNSVNVGALKAITPYDYKNDMPVIGMSGRFAPQRNPSLFFQLARALSNRSTWVWIGAESADTAFPAYVTPSGWLVRDEAVSRVAGLDIYVQTSLWEGLSFGILEAMALGKPVVASRVPANEAVIRHGENGFLARSEHEMLDVLGMLLDDATLRQKIGHAAQQDILDHYSAEAVIPRYGEIYHSITDTWKTFYPRGHS